MLFFKIFLISLLSFLFNICMFDYIKFIHLSNQNKKRFTIILSIINTLLIVAFDCFGLHDWALLVGAFILIIVEYFLVYKQSLLKTFFISFLFTFILYISYMFFSSILKLIFYNNYDVRSFLFKSDSLIVAYGMAVIIIFCMKKFLPVEKINVLNTSRESIKIIVNVCFIIFFYSLYVTLMFDFYDGDNHDYQHRLKTSLFILTYLIFAFYCAFLYAKFHLYRIQSNNIEQQMLKLKQEEKEFINTSNIESMTGVYKRGFGVNYLKDRLSRSIGVFSVSFIDLDGLKTVNDNYGHHEGDKYIKRVVNVLGNVFSNCMISRHGGDEFLVIFEDQNSYDVEKSMMIAYETVMVMKKLEGLSYDMSFSYGVYEVNGKTNLTYDEILNLVDEKMYDFKLSRKKSRK